MFKALVNLKAAAPLKYRVAEPEDSVPATPHSVVSDVSNQTVESEGGTKAENQLLIRVAVLLIDELRIRLRRCFEQEWLLQIGVSWGDNAQCGQCFCVLHRSSLSECKELTELDRDLLLQGHIAGLPIRSLFHLLLNVVTNRQRRVDEQPRYLARNNAAPPTTMRRPYGINRWPRPETGSVEVTRRCVELQSIHREFFELWNEYKQKTTKVLPPTEQQKKESALHALARSSTKRFEMAAKSAHAYWSNRSSPKSRPSSAVKKDSVGHSPVAALLLHLPEPAQDPRVLARSEDYLGEMLDDAIRCLRELGPHRNRCIAFGLSWKEFRERPLPQLISEKLVSRECHACLSGLTMRNDPYRERLHKTKDHKRKLLVNPVSKVIAARRVNLLTRQAVNFGGKDPAEENKIYRQGLRNARRRLQLYVGVDDDDDDAPSLLSAD